MHSPQSKSVNQSTTQGQASIDFLADDFVARLRNGERPSIADYAGKHPGLANEINDLFPTLAMLEQFGKDVSASAEPDVATPPLEHVGLYRIVREIGRGGMGVVYEAEHSEMQRRVALKVLPPELATNPIHLRRFRREARAAGGLHHTNIVPVFEVGHADGVHFYSMQFIRGQSLDRIIRELRDLADSSMVPTPTPVLGSTKTQSQSDADSIAERLLSGTFQNPSQPLTQEASAEYPFTVANDLTGNPGSGADSSGIGGRRPSYFLRVARLGWQIADALSYAHAQGVLHRDIKPANLILDSAGIVWLTDFGLAKYEDADLTRTGNIVGTLRYLAPERLNGQADPRSDVYALGLTLYELCTLRPAFDETDRVQLIRQVTSEAPASLRQLNRFVPRDLETIILKAIDKHPANRYQNAEQMAEDLHLFVADRPVQARRSPISERVWRWCRRNPVISSLTATVMLLLGLLLCGSLWFTWASRQQSLDLKQQKELAQASEKRALTSLFDARRAQATAARYSGRIGRRVGALAALEDAVSLVPRVFETAEGQAKARYELRNEAIGCLGNSDLSKVKTWPVSGLWTTCAAFDGNCGRYALSRNDGQIVIRRTVDDQELLTLPSPGWRAWVMMFSGDGRYLAARYHPDREKVQMIAVWDLQERKQIVSEPGPLTYAPFEFSQDSKIFFVGVGNATIHAYDLPGGTLKVNQPKTLMQPLEIACDPMGKTLAVSDSSSHFIQCIDLENGESRSLVCEGYLFSLVWSPDGTRLHGGCDDGNIYIWNALDWEEPPRKIEGHKAAVTNLAINQRGDRLVSSSWDGTTRVWDLETKTELVRVEGARLLGRKLTENTQQIGFASPRDEIGVWRLIEKSPHRVLNSGAKERWQVAYFPNFKDYFYSTTSSGLEIWKDTEPQRKLIVRKANGSDCVPLPNGKGILTFGSDGIFIWETQRNKQQELEVGEAEIVSSRSATRGAIDSASTNLAILSHSKVAAINLAQPGFPLVEVGEHDGANTVEISPDGRWIVTATWHKGGGVKVWDRINRALHVDLEPGLGQASMAFSPNGKWLAIGSRNGVSIREVGTWTVVHVVDRDPDDDWSPSITFSPDSELVVAHYSKSAIQLISVSTGERLAILESNQPGLLTSLRFSPNGNFLIGILDGKIQLWDLLQLKVELQQLGLYWKPAQATVVGTALY